MSGLRASFSALGAQAFIRVAVEARRRAVWYIDAIVAPPSDPPGWQPQVWEYADVTFIAAQVPAAALAAALDPADAQVLPLGGYRLTLPVLSDQVQWQHKPSSRPV
jgi:hypothetical protein